ATVWLYVDNLASSAGWMLRLPFFRYMTPADVLYHEVGHHIHTVHKPIHEKRRCCLGLEPQAICAFREKTLLVHLSVPVRRRANSVTDCEKARTKIKRHVN